MKNGICVIRAFGKCLKGFVSRKNQQIDASAVCFFLYLVHDGERSISAGANHEASAFPGYPFQGKNDPPRSADPALLRAVARARRWFEEITSGRVPSSAEIARREGLQ